MQLKINDISESEMIPEQDRKNEFEFRRTELLSNLSFIEMMYKEQADGIEKRIENRKSDMFAKLSLFAVVFVVDTMLGLMLMSPGGSILGLATEVWLSVIYLFIALIKTGYSAFKSVWCYMVHTEQKICSNYIKEHNVFTLQAERRYCVVQKLKVHEMYEELQKLSFDMPYKKYEEVSYIEKRADGDIFDGYTIKDVFAVIVFIIALIIAF